jgi:hypothetical protein
MKPTTDGAAERLCELIARVESAAVAYFGHTDIKEE